MSWSAAQGCCVHRSQLARLSTVDSSWADTDWLTNWIPLVATVSQGAAVLCAVFMLPETLDPSSRAGKESLRVNPLAGLTVIRRSELFRRLMACVVVYFFTYEGLYQYSTFYEQRVLDFSRDQFATNELIHSVFNIVLLGGLIKSLCTTFQVCRPQPALTLTLHPGRRSPCC